MAEQFEGHVQGGAGSMPGDAAAENWRQGCATTRQGEESGTLAPSARPIDREVLLGLQEAVVAVSITGQVLLVNRAAESLWGWPRDEATGQHVDRLLGAGVDLAQNRNQRLRTRHKVNDTSDNILLLSCGTVTEHFDISVSEHLSAATFCGSAFENPIVPVPRRTDTSYSCVCQ